MTPPNNTPPVLNKTDKLQQAIARNKKSLSALNTEYNSPVSNPVGVINTPLEVPTLLTDSSEGEQVLKRIQDDIQRDTDDWTSESEFGTAWGETKQTASQALDVVNRTLKGGAHTFLSSPQTDALREVPDDVRAIFDRKRQYKDSLAQIKQKRLQIDKDLLGGKINGVDAERLKTGLKVQEDSLVPITQDEEKLLGKRNVSRRYPYSSYESLLEIHGRGLKTAEGIDEFFEEEVGSGTNTRRLDAVGESINSYAERYEEEFFDAADAFNTGDYVTAGKKALPAIAKTTMDSLPELLENPGAVKDLVSEGLAQVAPYLINPAVGAASNFAQSASESGSVHREGFNDFVEANDRLPTKVEQREMDALALVHGVANYAGNAVTGKVLAPTPSVRAAREKLLKGLGDKLPDSKVLKGMARTATGVGDVAKAGASEYATGLVQAGIETGPNAANYDAHSWDAGDVVQGAIFEGVGGAGPGAVGTGVSAAKKVVEKLTSPVKENVLKNKAVTAKQEEAIQTGVLDEFTDSSAKGFNLSNSLDTIAARNSKDITKEERTTNYQKAVSLVGDQFEQLAQIEAALGSATGTEKGKLQKDQKRLSKEVSLAKDKLKAIASEITQTKDVGQMVHAVTTATEATPEFTAAAQKIISTLQVNPEGVPLSDIQAIAQSRVLSASSRDYLNKLVTAQQAIESADAVSIGSVREDVLHGDSATGKKGLEQFRAEIVAALHLGDMRKVRILRTDLASLTTNHSEKSEIFDRGFAPFRQANNTGKQYTPTPEHKALIQSIKQRYNTTRPGPDGTTGFNMNRGSARVVEAVQLEAKALVAGLAEVDAIIDGVVDVQATVTPNSVNKPSTTQTLDDSVPVSDTVNDAPDWAKEELPVDTREPVKSQEVPVNASTPEQSNEVTEQATPGKGPENQSEAAQQQETSSQDQEETAATTNVDQAQPETQEAEAEVSTDPDTEGNTFNLAESLLGQEEPLLHDPENPADAFYHENKIHRHFTVRDTADAETQNVLQREAGFLGKLKTGTDFLQKYLSQPVLTPNQVNLLNNFQQVSEGLVEAFHDNLPHMKSVKYRYQNYMDYLRPVNAQGQSAGGEASGIDPNVAVAVSVVAYNWISNSAWRTLYNDDEAANAILGRDKGAAVPTALSTAMSKAGTLHSTLAESLGMEIYNLLGFQEKAGAPENTKTNLIMSLGNAAVATLTAEGYLTRQNVPAEDLHELLPEDEVGNYRNRKVKFYTFVRATTHDVIEEGVTREQLIPAIQDIMDHGQDTGSLFTNLFGVQEYLAPPTLSPVDHAPKRMKGSIQKVPEKAQEMVRKANNRPQSIKQDVDTAFLAFDEDQQLRMMGEPQGTQTKHVVNRNGAEGKRDSLKRELVNYKTWRELLLQEDKGLNTPFYFSHEIWKQMRVGMQGNLINPQRSKLHRHLVKDNSWQQTVSLKGDTQRMSYFRVALAQALGVSIDKKTNEQSLQELDNILSTPEVETAVEGLLILLDQEKREALDQAALVQHQESVVKAVDTLGEHIHTFDGLVNYAKMIQAVRNEDNAFVTDLSLEVDGVTNGPIIGMIQFAAAGSALELGRNLHKGAIFDNGNTSYGKWAENPLNLDAYKEIGKAWYGALGDKFKQHHAAATQGSREDARTLRALSSLADLFGRFVVVDGDTNQVVMDESTGEPTLSKQARNASKNPLMVTIYGSSDNSVKEALGNSLVQRVYERIEEITEDDQGGEQLQVLENQINALLAYARTLKGVKLSQESANITLPISPAEALEFELDANVSRAISTVMQELYGEPLINAIDTKYSQFKEERTTLNTTMKTVFHIFDAMYQDQVQRRTAALVAEGRLFKDKHGELLETLPQSERNQILTDLQDAMPIMHTIFSMESGNVSEGIFVGKERKERQYGNAYKQVTRLRPPKSKGMPFLNDTGQWDAKGTLSMTSHGFTSVFKDGGVSPAIMGIHSIDAYVALSVMSKHGVLGVHDGFYGDVDQITSIAEDLNKDFAEAMEKYSLPEQAQGALDRALGVLSQYEKQHGTDLTSQIEQDIHASLPKKLRAQLDAQGMIQNAKAEATAQTTTINTRKARFLATPNLYWSQYNVEGGGYLTNPENTDTSLRANRVNAVADAPANPSATLVENFLNTNPDYDTEDLVNFVASQLGNKQLSTTQRAVMEVLKKLRSTLPGGVKVVVVGSTNQDVIPDYMKAQWEGSQGVADPNTHTVYLRKESLEGSDDRGFETLSHELIHIQTSRMLQKVAKGEMVSAQVQRAVKELENVRKVVAQHIARNPELGRYAPAVESIDEMLAWGLTNEGFQQVMQDVRVKRSKAGWINGFKQLVQQLQQILFTSSNLALSKKMTSALENLVTNSAVIFDGSQAFNKPAGKPEFEAAPQKIIDEMSPGEVLDNLDRRDPVQRSDAHKSHLKAIQDKVVNVVAGPFGVRLRDAEGALGDQADQFIRNMVDGAIPFTSKLRNAGFRMSRQEAYVAEQIEASMASILDTQTGLTKEIQQLWALAKDPQTGIKPTDFKTDPSITDEVAQAMWDSVFVPSADKPITAYSATAEKKVTYIKSNYLHRFAALALTHEPFMNLLQRVEGHLPKETLDGKTFGKQLEIVLKRVLDALDRWINPAKRIEGKAQQRVEGLMKALAEVEQRKKATVQQEAERTQHPVNRKLDKLLNTLRNKAEQFSQSDKVKNSQSAVAGAVGTAVSAVVGDRADLLIDGLQQVRDRLAKGRQGTLNQLVTEIKGSTPDTRKFFNLLRFANRDVDQARSQAKEYTADMIRNAFKDSLTGLQEAALTKVLLKTDMASVLGKYSLSDLGEFLQAGSKSLKDEISKLENQLGALPHGTYYRNQSAALGYFMATGRVTTANQMTNAHNITHLGGDTGSRNVKSADADKAMEIIDQLATLRALQYTDQGYKDVASELLRTESRNEAGSGVEFILRLSKQMNDQALEQLFDNNPTQYVKGYTFEILNHHKTFKVANEIDGIELEAQGYSKIEAAIGKDPGDSDQSPMYMYVIHDGGTAGYLAGIISLTNKVAKGTSLAASHLQNGDESAFRNSRTAIQDVLQGSKGEIDNLFNQRDFDPTKVKGNRLLPTLNQYGDVHQLRYVMAESTKDNVLEKHNAVADVLGALAGNIVDKQATKENNATTVDALYAQYKVDYHTRPDSYLEVGPQSTDPRLREIWFMLPDETKHKAQKVWGRKGMLVRNDILDMTFGYRKWSLANTWKVAPEERQFVQRAFIQIVESTPGLGKKAASRIKMGEQMWQELIKGVKDILVIKNIFTLTGNVVSNFWLLRIRGVGLRDALKFHKEGYEGVLKYQNDHRELYQLKAKLASQQLSGAQVKDIQGRIVQLENDLTHNPVRELVEAGVFQTIVEDIDTHEDPFSFKSKLALTADKYTSQVPDKAKDTSRWLTLSHDTAGYKFLNHSTQISDFVARYVEYKHLTERAAEPMSKVDAVNQIMDDFVNYDVPSGQKIQYLNDMGLLMFSKYFLRMQRPLMKMFRDNPANMLWVLAMQQVVDFSAPTDSSFLDKNPLNLFYNPFSTAVDAPDEIAPINALAHVVGVK